MVFDMVYLLRLHRNSLSLDFLRHLSSDSPLYLSLAGAKTSLLLSAVDLDATLTQFLQTAVSLGFKEVLVSSAEWVQANVDPLSVTPPVGLTVRESVSSFFTPGNSSVFCVQEMVQKTASYATQGIACFMFDLMPDFNPISPVSHWRINTLH